MENKLTEVVFVFCPILISVGELDFVEVVFYQGEGEQTLAGKYSEERT